MRPAYKKQLGLDSAATRRIEPRLFAMRTWVALLWGAVVLLLLLQQAASGGEDGVRELGDPPKGTLRTIQSLDGGDIVDCVLRHHQLALEHPLLKNHIIQEFPSFIPINDHTNGKIQEQSSSYETFQVWHQNEKCPYGTIPILRKDPSHGPHKKHPHQFPRTSSQIPRSYSPEEGFSNHEHAIAYYQSANTSIYGASFISNQWNPSVELAKEFSLSQMWIVAGTYENSDLNTIEVGWQVCRSIYGDDATHLFIYWTADAYKTTGCYNLGCPGFVQVDNTIVIGGSLQPSSTYEGNQVELPQIIVWKDFQTQNWWLQYGTKVVGYWPKEIYTHLSNNGGEEVQWGGEVVNTSPGGSHTSTQMGSGHFANEGYQKACYTRSLALVDTTKRLYAIPTQYVATIATNPNCYSIDLETYDNWGTSFFFGGPGKNVNCP